MVVSNPPFFVTLIAGLLIAFALQLLLTNLGIAAGITALGYLPDQSSESSELSFEELSSEELSSEQSESEASNSPDNTAQTIGFALGFGTLLTVNSVLFAACFLAVKLSLADHAIVGAILGVVIWSAYFLILVWLGSTAVGAVLDSVLGVLSSGWQGLRAIAKPIFTNSSKTLETQLRQQITAEMATISETQRQLSQANASRIQATLQQYLELQRSQLEKPVPPPPNAETEVLDFLKSAPPDELTPDELRRRLQRLTEATSLEVKDGQSLSQSTGLAIDFKTLLRAIRSRIDLSDLDVTRVLSQIQSFNHPIGQAVAAIGRFLSPTTTIQADVEDYLLNAYPWQLTRKTVKLEFKDVIYDREADPQLLQPPLGDLNRDQFVEILTQRDDLSSRKIAKIADRLEAVRLEVLETLEQEIMQESLKRSQQPVVEYLQSADKEDLKPKLMQKQLKTLQATYHLRAEVFLDWLDQLQRQTVVASLAERQDLESQEIEQIADQLETMRDRLIEETREAQAKAKAEAETLWQKLLTYLSDRNEKLNARNIQRQVKRLLKETSIDLETLTSYIPAFDPEKVLQTLKARQDLTEKRIQQVGERVEKTWNDLLTPVAATSALISPIEDVYSQLKEAIAHYLQTLDGSDLNLETIQRDLLNLLDQPQLLSLGLAPLFTQIDWDSLMHQLRSQGLTEEQTDRVIHQAQQVLYRLGKFPRRWVVRSQNTLQDIPARLQEYLHDVDKEDLRPEAIQRDLKRLLQGTQTGLQEVLSQFNRSNLVQFLTKRGDLLEEEATQVVDQIETTFNHLLGQLEATQQQGQAALGNVLGNIGNALDSLELPEMNYDRIQQELQQLIKLPQEKLESVKQETYQRVEDVKQQAQQQIEATRKATAIAAWWLFSIALTSLLSSAIAGTLAVTGLTILEGKG